ncbi:MAG: guanylate kinase [Chloroflexota bacterium]
MAPRTGLLVVVSGPSGVGKDAVLAALRRMHPEFHYPVTATTRPQRPGEVDGRDYLFISPERFEQLLAQGGFLEHAQVYGRRYGVPKARVRDELAAGHDVVVKVDVQGAQTIRALAPDTVLVFLAAPSMDELERRLRERKTESPEQLAIRIATAREEMEQASWFDRVIVNGTEDVEGTVAKLVAVMEEEHTRVPAREVRL